MDAPGCTLARGPREGMEIPGQNFSLGGFTRELDIGSQGFYHQGGGKARFDQQPIEAAGAVSACLEAYRITGDKRWRADAWSAFNWFLGDNDLQLPLYDSTTGGCRDGLHPERANQNQGAESTLSFSMALLEMQALHNSEPSTERANDPS